jgi:hypothetical protein
VAAISFDRLTSDDWHLAMVVRISFGSIFVPRMSGGMADMLLEVFILGRSSPVAPAVADRRVPFHLRYSA